MSFQEDVQNYVCSGHALLHVNTYEKSRAIDEIKAAAKDIKYKVYIWTMATGWEDEEGKAIEGGGPMDRVEPGLAMIGNFPEETLFVMKDFGPYLHSATYPSCDVVISWIEYLRQHMQTSGQAIIFVGPDFNSPVPLRHDITEIDFSLPTPIEIEAQIKFACEYVLKNGDQFEPNQDMIPQIIDACRGMTQQQIVDRVTLALRKHGDFDEEAVKTIVREKGQVIKSSGLLTYIEPPPGGLSIVGGYEALKQHVILDKPCFTQEARDFGIEFPKGLVLAGVPGCGKTLLSIAIASELKLPLISMDVGNIMDKLVGESEAKMRLAIQMLESVCPCVLQLDEIEKGFGGAGDMDGGTSRRVFGTFLKWLNDRTSPVYAVATANQVSSLPPEFSRKGRFDEIFGLDLPMATERRAIFDIHLSKRNRDSKQFDLETLANMTEGYTGSDIEQIIKSALKLAFYGKDQLSDKHLQVSVKEIVPLSRTEKTRIDSTREWIKSHAKLANQEESPVASKKSRKVSIRSDRGNPINLN